MKRVTKEEFYNVLEYYDKDVISRITNDRYPYIHEFTERQSRKLFGRIEPLDHSVKYPVNQVYYLA
jgi:hypothetical protein